MSSPTSPAIVPRSRRLSPSSATRKARRHRRPTHPPPPPMKSLAAADSGQRRRRPASVDMFNNDVRLRALRTLADTLAPLEQKKAILYFSAGMERSGQDNQVELRTADQLRRPRPCVDLPGRHARLAGGRARRRCAAGERTRSVALFRARRGAAVFAACRLAGHADVARRRYRWPRVHRHQRFRRSVHARAPRHVRVLPARLQQHQPCKGRTLPPHPGQGQTRRVSASKRAPATSPIATSRTPIAAIARHSCRSSCSRRCPPLICP